MDVQTSIQSGVSGDQYRPLDWSAHGGFSEIMADTSQKIQTRYDVACLSREGAISVGWLKFSVNGQDAKPSMPVDEKIRMRSEMYRFSEDFGLIMSDHLATSSFATDITGGNWIALQLRLMGRTIHRFLDRTEVWQGPSTIAYLLPDGYRMGFVSEEAQKIQAVTLMIRAGYLKRTFPEMAACLSQEMLEENPSKPCVSHYSLSDELIKSLTVLVRMRAEPAYPRLLMHGKALDLLVGLLSSLGRPPLLPLVEPNNHRYTKNLESARSIIDQNFANPPAIPALSSMVGLNRRTLNEGFKQQFGATVYQYCIRQRMNRALDLLVRECRSVTETAFEVGYSDLASFSRAFKQFYGVQPGKAQRRS